MKRAAGKISRSEWPLIVARRLAGESFARIAGDYGCSPPAIRYIVKQSQLVTASAARGGAVPERAESPGAETLAPYRRPLPDLSSGRGASASEALGNMGGLRERISSEIAAFLVVFDSVLIQPSPANVDRLVHATDRLMRAAARMRIELEALEKAAESPPA